MTIYLRPQGLFSSSLQVHGALPLSNTDLSFNMVEIIERRGNNIRHEVVGLQDLQLKALANPEIASLLQRIIAPRAAWAGLSLDQTRIMGILNITPDSFSDGGQFFDSSAAINHAQRMMKEGADIIDIGGESTRPKAIVPSVNEELQRTIPVIEKINKNTIISIDTRRAVIMEKSIDAGAAIVNDISALTHDPQALAFVAQNNIPVVLMHMQGTPETMQDNPQYDHAALDVYDYLKRRIEVCENAGLKRDKIIIDPGIGFGKTVEHNLTILSHLSMFHGLGCGILIGVSRKSFIGKMNDNADVSQRLPGSLAAALYAINQGAQILRVHDVAETKQACHVWQAYGN